MSRVIHVAVAGARGKLGSVAHRAFCQSAEFDYAGGFARVADPQEDIVDSLDELFARNPEVLIDATTMPSSFEISMTALARGCRPVVGASGWSAEQREALASQAQRLNSGAMIVPNFSIGAVLMMRFAQEAARFMPIAEIVEMHRSTKRDKPSGTALQTAARIASATGAAPPPIHSVRLPGLVAHQEVLFGGTGELLTIRHDSLSHESFVAGILAAARAVIDVRGLAIGLEEVLVGRA